VIAAAGNSVRMEGEDKLFIHVCGKPILAHTIDIFQRNSMVSEIIIVTREDRIAVVGELCGTYSFDKVSKIMIGGPTRLESVLNGVMAVSKSAKLIAIHDGARPCVSETVVNGTIEAAAKFSAAAPAVKASSTIKKVKNGIVVSTAERDSLFEIQTPQVFKADIIKSALTSALGKSIEMTDDCMAVELIGVPIHTTEGSRNNIKITTREDIAVVEALLRNRV